MSADGGVAAGGETGWVRACATGDVAPEEVIRFDHGSRTFAICRTGAGDWYATDGLCTHAAVHLAGGLVVGTSIECPRHGGRFDLRTGEAVGPPACLGLVTHPTQVRDGSVYIALTS